jgi:hypothetical protein
MVDLVTLIWISCNLFKNVGSLVSKLVFRRDLRSLRESISCNFHEPVAGIYLSLAN